MDDRRGSRIPAPRAGFGLGASKPLENSRAVNASTGDRKRKADYAMEPIEEKPQNKRQTMSACQAANVSSRSISTAGAAKSVASARTGTTQPPFGSALAPVTEDSWDDISDRTKLSVDDVLNKKLNFAKGTKAERKVEMFVPFVKELRALGKHLRTENQRLAFDTVALKNHADELTAEAEESKRSSEATKAEKDKKVEEMGQIVAALEQENKKVAAALKEVEQTLAVSEANFESLQESYTGLQDALKEANKQLEERNNKIREREEQMASTQRYSADLQTYNTALQADLTADKARLAEAQRARTELQGQVAELGGKVRSMEQQLVCDREQLSKLREERETSTRDLATLRSDLENTRQERERAIAEAAKAKEDLDRVRTAGGKSLETLEALNNDKATMETQIAVQQKLILSMREELAREKAGRAEAAATADTRAQQMDEMKAQILALQASLSDAERRVYEGELIRRKLHNIIQDLKGNIRVFCRVRPVSSAEVTDTGHDSALALDFPTSGDQLGRGLTLTVPSTSPTQPIQKHNFAFDRVFSQGTTQEVVFDEISELVQSALDGHKVCIFAYGQTGSGKTFTMVGDRENPGVIPRAMKQIFESGQKLATQGWQFNMQASMLEIYNEEIRDLLSRKKDDKKHQVSHDANGTTTVSDLTTLDVNRPEAVDQLLSQAMDKRSVGCTALNEQSSRSHMVFIMRIEGYNSAKDVKVSGVLNLIDLAGSERVKESGAVGQRLKEAQAINKSLSALGDVIMAIANKQEHVPFRNSKLTYLLQPCLGGDAKTLMFLNVAPTREFAGESLCSLRFGAKVNACEINAPKKNVVVPRG